MIFLFFSVLESGKSKRIILTSGKGLLLWHIILIYNKLYYTNYTYFYNMIYDNIHYIYVYYIYNMFITYIMWMYDV